MLIKLIRRVLGFVILWLDKTFKPRPISREPAAQARLDAATAPLAP